MSANLEIQLVCSPIGCPPDQRSTVRGLGLTRLQQKRVVVDTPQMRGMITKVCHLVTILGTAAAEKKIVKTPKASAKKKTVKKVAKE